MLDTKLIEANPDRLKTMLRDRNVQGIDVDKFLRLVAENKHNKQNLQEKQAERNKLSKEIGFLLAKNKKESQEVQKIIEKIKSQVSAISSNLNELKEEIDRLENEIYDIQIEFPNWIADDVPRGGEENNKIIEEWGGKKNFDFKPQAHYEIAEALGYLDIERGVKLAGSRFYTYKNLLARLERSLISFMLDLHTQHFNYTELFVPLLINDEGMFTTGQFPKFKNDYYHLKEDGLSLIPTSEVPLVNLYRNEILQEKDIPIFLTTATSCFRREAGAAGKDTRGLVRVHQFQKVELVCFCHPQKSEEVHQEMLGHAKEVLRLLNLPYRIILKSVGDTGSSAAKSYDLEVWMPGLGNWLEISSISNCYDYQARRGQIRYKEKNPLSKNKNPFVHTLNGSGLAAGRTMIALIENYQNADGSFDIPPILESYLNKKNFYA